MLLLQQTGLGINDAPAGHNRQRVESQRGHLDVSEVFLKQVIALRGFLVMRRCGHHIVQKPSYFLIFHFLS
ncbi:hypothetical protein A8950_1987 [Dongia mobilis]|uniref:Uncharacterized protein n=1 Tax=Dongia mobilis TaxID=578943 RepID=A0A4R6WX67_9PROT|nr:hypothetical protein A8950_1987 [Dongia mobilis]